MGIVVIGAVFVDVKGYPEAAFIPNGRNVGRVEQIHGGVGRNVAEDIANCELRPTFISLVDNSGTGEDVIRKLGTHKVNTDYIRKTRNGMGTWLAVFDNNGDVAGSISKRPDMLPIAELLEEKGEYVAVRSMRKHIGWYVKGLSGAVAVRRNLNQLESASDIMEGLERLVKGEV